MQAVCNQCKKLKKDVYRGKCQTCYKKNLIEERQLQAPKIPCACGCGELIPSIGKNGLPQTYKNNHHTKGENNGNYKKGWFMRDNYKILTGYRGHPNASKKGEIPEHVLVMCNHLGRPLTKTEVVHHIDPVREGYCNNDISNLQLVDRSKHLTIHNNEREYTRKDMTGTICIECGSDKTYPDTRTGEPHWMKHPITKEEYVCEKCYKRIKFQNKIQVSYRRKDFSGRICLGCGAQTSVDVTGSSTWRSYIDQETGYKGFVCKHCFDTKFRQ